VFNSKRDPQKGAPVKANEAARFFSVSRGGAAQTRREIGVEQTVNEVLAGLPAHRQPSGDA
jgi:hypothetical protein